MTTVDTAFGDGPASGRRFQPRTLVLALAVIGMVLAAFLAFRALTGDDEKSGELKGSSTDAFTLTYPKGWRALSEKDLVALSGRPLAVVRRQDGRGTVILRREKRAPGDFSALSGDLTRSLEKRVPDFRRQSSRTVNIPAGKAFFYSYVRTRKNTVHSILVVPAGDRSYALNTVSSGGAEDVARETAKIILSFDVEK